MKKIILAMIFGFTISQVPSFAISEAYREQLERSGCTQISELAGCDVNKTKEENMASFYEFAGEYSGVNSSNDDNFVLLIGDGVVTINGYSAEAVKLSDKLIIVANELLYLINSKDGGFWLDATNGTSGNINKLQK